MTVRTLDINCDCGEGFGRWRLGNDAGVMEHVSSVNLACGFHAGDPLTMHTAVGQAKERGVAIGAHPGLPDLLGFGRRYIDWNPEDAFASIAYQVGAMQGVLAINDAQLHHVKLHGVLPGMVARDEKLADAAVRALLKAAPDALIYSPASRTSIFHRLAREAGLEVVEEVYADMRYDDEGHPVVEPVKSDTPIDVVEARIRQYIREGTVNTITGDTIEIEAGSVSLHGDAGNAVEVAAAARRVIEQEGGQVATPPRPSERQGA